MARSYIEFMANKVNLSRKKSQVSREIYLFLASFLHGMAFCSHHMA